MDGRDVSWARPGMSWGIMEGGLGQAGSRDGQASGSAVGRGHTAGVEDGVNQASLWQRLSEPWMVPGLGLEAFSI